MGIPFVIIFALYWLTDPFRINKKFTLEDAPTVNREYISTELFLLQNSKYKYNSFVFSSSRGCRVNTYVWKKLLEETTTQKDTVSQFLFQSWAENIYGIEQKINFLDKNNIAIDNALLLIDYDCSFITSNNDKAFHKRHYLLANKSKFSYRINFFLAYLSKPSKIVSSITNVFQKSAPVFDTISNDWLAANRHNTAERPEQDFSLNKSKFSIIRSTNESFAAQAITPEYENVLRQIKKILDKHHTNYKLFVTPTYNQIHINQQDFQLLQEIFGKENVSNFSGKNAITEDKYNFSDVAHFDLVVGWDILHKIYKNDN